MNSKERTELDRHITGNYGEDQFGGDITEYLVNCLAEIANLPKHPCDDARNLAALEKAKMIAEEAVATLSFLLAVLAVVNGERCKRVEK